MFVFFEYLRNITYYLIFATVAGMLAPAGKYKKFVTLVLGFMLLALMLQPVALFIRTTPENQWFPAVLPVGHAPPFPEFAENADAAHDHWRDNYLRQAFEAQLEIQLSTMLSLHGFIVYDSQFTYTLDFSQLTAIHVTLSYAALQEPTRVPFIRIQPVQPVRIITPFSQAEADLEEICEITKNAKNLISQFYNLPIAHIYVEVIHQ